MRVLRVALLAIALMAPIAFLWSVITELMAGCGIQNPPASLENPTDAAVNTFFESVQACKLGLEYADLSGVESWQQHVKQKFATCTTNIMEAVSDITDNPVALLGKLAGRVYQYAGKIDDKHKQFKPGDSRNTVKHNGRLHAMPCEDAECGALSLAIDKAIAYINASGYCTFSRARRFHLRYADEKCVHDRSWYTIVLWFSPWSTNERAGVAV